MFKESFKRWQRLKELKEECKTAQFNRDAAKAFEKIICNPDAAKVIISVIGFVGSILSPKPEPQELHQSKPCD
jgi:nicotinic acid mononucleotide adenylyltransferase